MKTTLLLIALASLSLNATAQLTPAQQVAAHQAQSMHDSLNLTVPQRDSIYSCNMQLFARKKASRQQFIGSPEETRAAVQKVENTRDSLYRTILPAIKYGMYLEKKISLLAP